VHSNFEAYFCSHIDTNVYANLSPHCLPSTHCV